MLMLVSACESYLLNNGSFTLPPGRYWMNQQSSNLTYDRLNGAIGSGEPNEEAHEEPNNETYAYYNENPYLQVVREPLSTFSIDVDTASYSNIRRFLQEGKLPPKDAVRIAEMVNYFPYDYTPPHTEHPVALHVDGASCPWEPKHRLVRVALKAKSYSDDNMPPRNLVFLIDVSGSMNEPKRLPLVKESLRLLVEKLTEKDRVSIVTYAGDTSVRLHATPGHEKRKILHIIDSLKSEGSTNGSSGIELAYQQARTAFISNGVNRVILATDGDFNVGITSEAELIRFIEEKRKTGVYLSILGYGFGNLKDSTMQKLAHHGRGHYAYIDSLDEARKLFVEQGGALAVVANDVKVQIEFNPKQVGSYRLIGYESRLLRPEDFKNDATFAGDMGSGHCVTALYELIPAGENNSTGNADALKYQQTPKLANVAGNGEWLTAKVRYKLPEETTSKEISAVLPALGMKMTPTGDFRFAMAVTAFGMLLRDSEFKGNADYAGVLAIAKDAVGEDKTGRRSDFLKLVKLADALDKKTPKEADDDKATPKEQRIGNR
jgi:Ca-activated chloride channel family protein